MLLKNIKYFSTLAVVALAISAGWLLWNYYMQSPWTRDGKIRAELVDITPQVSGRITGLNVRDNQFVHAGTVLFTLDKAHYEIAVLNAQAQMTKSEASLAKAQNEASRRQHLPHNYISAEDLDSAKLSVRAGQAALKVAQTTLDEALWQLSQTTITAPVDGWITNLSSREGNYASAGKPVFALTDSHSFYVLGYFEETKLRHIHPKDKAKIILYSDNRHLSGTVESIGRAIYDQSVENGTSLIADIKPNVPWVRLAQRIPVRIALDSLPDNVTLISGMTCTIYIGK